MTSDEMPHFGFDDDDITTDQPTRSAPLKWVLVVDAGAPAGLQVNAAVCVAAAVGAQVRGLIAGGGPDASGASHPGLPWAGCTVLAAEGPALAALRTRAAERGDVLVVDMPAAAQTHRVYDDYLAELARTPTEDLALKAVALVGPRNRVDRLTKGLALLA